MCEIMVHHSYLKRCGPCREYRVFLDRKISRNKLLPAISNKCSPSSHVNYRYLNSPEKRQRLRKLHHQNRITKQKVTRMKARIEKLTEERSVPVDSILDTEIREIVTEQSSAVLQSHPSGSFGQLFWENQKRAMALKNARSMKWDPLIIRWSLYLRHVCGSGYEILRESGVIKLPCQRTLRDYTYYTKSTVGFSDDVDRQLMEAAKISECEEREKYVVLVMDEMHIKEDVVYNKHTGIINYWYLIYLCF